MPAAKRRCTIGFVRSDSAAANTKSHDLAAWLLGCLPAWLLGCLAAWLLGCLAAWLLGCLAAWLLGCLVLRRYGVRPAAPPENLRPFRQLPAPAPPKEEPKEASAWQTEGSRWIEVGTPIHVFTTPQRNMTRNDMITLVSKSTQHWRGSDESCFKLSMCLLFGMPWLIRSDRQAVGFARKAGAPAPKDCFTVKRLLL